MTEGLVAVLLSPAPHSRPSPLLSPTASTPANQHSCTLHIETVSLSVQVLQLQSTSASQQSPPVDHKSGIEAMVLAILQQANSSQHSELGDMAGLALQPSQDITIQRGLLLKAYSDLLADALAANAVVPASLGNVSAPSIIPASPQ